PIHNNHHCIANSPKPAPKPCPVPSTSPSDYDKTSDRNETAPSPMNNPKPSTSRNRYKPNVHYRNKAASQNAARQSSVASRVHNLRYQSSFRMARVNHKSKCK